MSNAKKLKINMATQANGTPENSTPLRGTQNGMKIMPFRFLKNYSDKNSDKKLGKYVNYKDPVLYKGKRWWIYYEFKIPPALRHLYKNKVWKGFRVFEDINRYKTDEYAQLLLESVKFTLKEGWNPFEEQERVFLEFNQADPDKKTDKVWTCVQAFNFFIQEWEHRGLEDATMTKLKRAIALMTAYLTTHNIQHGPVKNLTKKHVQNALREESDREEWSNRTFNNNVSALATVFIFLESEKIITDIPTKGIVKKKSKSKKHRYYDPEKFEKVLRIMKADDPLTYFATKLIYYLCIRAEKELKWFRVGNIFLDRKQVLIQAEESKTDADRYIPIPDELMEELTYIRKNYPPDYFVVGKGTRMKYVRDNTPASKPFAQNMISARFAKIRKTAGLSSEYTPYGFKHTRIIHLKQDGAQDADIMVVTGHDSYQAYAEYLRDLGISGNAEATNKISRKF